MIQTVVVAFLFIMVLALGGGVIYMFGDDR
jgi:hypothetical protein